jgi:hypothetical protein
MARVSNVSSVPVRLPLPTLLSHVLVAFTIEFDNESDRSSARLSLQRRGASL